MSEKRERMGEADPEEVKFQANRRGGVKLDASKSQFVPKEQTKDKFDKKVESYQNHNLDKNQIATKLAKDFLTIVRSKELSVNKGPIAKSTEKEVITDIVNFARNLNNDETETEFSSGSIALISLLIKSVLHQRDLYNELEFKLIEAEKQIRNLSSVGK